MCKYLVTQVLDWCGREQWLRGAPGKQLIPFRRIQTRIVTKLDTPGVNEFPLEFRVL